MQIHKEANGQIINLYIAISTVIKLTLLVMSTYLDVANCFCAGIISDIQYADIPNGASFSGTPRYYRSSLTCLQRAISSWTAAKVDFCIHLGDIVDGFNPPEAAERALDTVVAAFDQLGKPHYHMIGNHCLYHLSRPVSFSTFLFNLLKPEFLHRLVINQVLLKVSDLSAQTIIVDQQRRTTALKDMRGVCACNQRGSHCSHLLS